MTILEMIKEWRKGCSNTRLDGTKPEACPACTKALVEAIEWKVADHADVASRVRVLRASLVPFKLQPGSVGEVTLIKAEKALGD